MIEEGYAEKTLLKQRDMI